MKRIITLATTFMVLLAGAAHADQPVTVYGVVLDANDRPVRGARVFVMPPVASTCTGADGRFQMAVPVPGPGLIHVFAHANGKRLTRAVISGRPGQRRQASMVFGGGRGPRLRTGCQRRRAMNAGTWIWGEVADGRNDRNVAGARVRLVGTRQTVTTDAFGLYAIPVRARVPAGRRQRLVARKADREGTATVAARPGGWLRGDMLLTAASAEGSGGGSRAAESDGAEGGTDLRRTRAPTNGTGNRPNRRRR